MRKVLHGQLTLFVAIAILVVAAGALAYSAYPSSSSGSAVEACFNPGNGQLRVVDDMSNCNRGENAIDWKRVETQGSIVLSGSRTSPVLRSHFGPVGP